MAFQPGEPRPRLSTQRFPAAGGRASTPRETEQIARAVNASVLVAEVAGGVAVSRVRVSRLNPQWALATILPGGPDGPGPALGVLCRGPAGWVLRQVGTHDVGRDLVPAAVLVEFGLLGDPR